MASLKFLLLLIILFRYLIPKNRLESITCLESMIFFPAPNCISCQNGAIPLMNINNTLVSIRIH